MKHITSEKGSIGELRVTADMIDKGFQVFTPVSSVSPFDLLSFKDGKYYRVQVKYRKVTSKGCINVSMTRHSISKSSIIEVFNNYVDIMAIFCPDTGKCYYINSEDFNIHLALRIEKPKNNQLKGIRMAEDYIDIKSHN